jgi:hypothetical protein
MRDKKRKKYSFLAWAIFCEGEIWGKKARTLSISCLAKKQIDHSYFEENVPPLYLKRVKVEEI